MLFDSVTFWLFLVPVLLVWWFAPLGPAKTLVLMASCVFYAWWNPMFLLLVVASAVLDYLAAARIARSKTPGARKAWLCVSLVPNLGLLAFFKYTPLLVGDASRWLDWALPDGLFDEWIVPVGISFYTFQTISYSIDVYRGRLAPARSFRDFFLYVIFFPQLVAGPIVRASSFLPQLDRRPRWNSNRFEMGLYRCVQGLFFKVVVADNLAALVGTVFEGDVSSFSSLSAWIAVIAFGFQIFADFAGYSWIAIGIAMLMGLRFPVNFNAPYISVGLSEFWTRWHITLSSWLRDYLYIPLGGNREGRMRTHVNLWITMLLGGLWHGAAWTFLAWGALHALGLSVERWWQAVRGPRAAHFLRTASAMLLVFVFVQLTWVFFRASDFGVAQSVLDRMFLAPIKGEWQGHGVSLRYLVLWVPIVLLHATTLVQDRMGRRLPRQGRALMAGLMLAALFLVRRGEAHEFVYFQF
ncbi:MAG: MBOAT family protein [Planctomycetota bacterium]|nr:MBOAT family protein [Planctomycetota bacterium]